MYTITMKHAVPAASRLLVNTTSRSADYVDSFRVELPLTEDLSVDYLCATVFSATPRWVDWLMVLRNLLVSGFGLRTEMGNGPPPLTREVRFELGAKDCFFTLIDRSDEELVMAEGDKHLDFRVSVRKGKGAEGTTVLEVTTVVWYNNWLGPIYFNVVKPFHRMLLRDSMTRATERLIGEFGRGVGNSEVGASTAQRVAGWLGFVGGLGLTALGVMHFPLAFEMVARPAFAQLSREASDFVVLLCLCVGLLLLLVGGLAVYFSQRLKRGDNTARGVFLTVAVALLGRTVLDVLYPLAILGETPAVAQNLLFVALCFALPTILAGRGLGVPCSAKTRIARNDA